MKHGGLVEKTRKKYGIGGKQIKKQRYKNKNRSAKLENFFEIYVKAK